MIRTTLTEKAQSLTRRKEALGIKGRVYVAANSGMRRTPGKRDLLRTLEADAEARGTRPRFRANIG